MNRFKRIYVLLGVLAVLCIATFALTRFEEKQEAIQNSNETILEIPSDTVTALSWEYANADSALAFHKGEETWLYDADEAFPVDEEKVMEILSHFEDFGAAFIIEDVEDYSQYGLEKSECTIHLSAGEKTYDIRLGDFSRLDEQRYVDIGDGNVYLVGEDPANYVNNSLSSMILHDDAPGFETVESITFEGDQNYTITMKEESPDTYSEEDIYFVDRDGKNVPLDAARVRRYLNTVTSLDLMTYVTYNATEEELASYGLDDPELSVTVNYTHTEENGDEEETVSDTFVFHISRNPEELAAAQEAEANGEAAKNVSKYVRIGDSQIVYELDDVDYGILSDASYDGLRHREVIWADFEDMTRIDISLEGEAYTLSSVYDEEEKARRWYYGLSAEETAETETTAETEAEEVSEEEDGALDMTGFRTALEALSADSFTGETPTGKEEISLTVHLDHENFPSVEIGLYRYDGEWCLAVVDGESVCLVSRSSVVDLIEAVNAIVL